MTRITQKRDKEGGRGEGGGKKKNDNGTDGS